MFLKKNRTNLNTVTTHEMNSDRSWHSQRTSQSQALNSQSNNATPISDTDDDHQKPLNRKCFEANYNDINKSQIIMDMKL